MPATTPEEPQNLAAVVGDSQVALTWEAPLNDGGRPVTSYEVSSDGNTWVEVDIDDTQYTFTKLTNGTEYTFSVRAVNQMGNGEEANIKSTPVSRFSYRVLTDDSTGITVAGYFTSDAILKVTSALPHEPGICADCDEIRAKQKAGEVYALYDIAATGEYEGTLEVTIPVGNISENSILKLIHYVNGIHDERNLTVTKGAIKDTFSSLSPFVIFKQNDITNKSGKTIQIDKKNNLPKTGNTPYVLVSSLLLTAGLATLIYQRKKQK